TDSVALTESAPVRRARSRSASCWPLKGRSPAEDSAPLGFSSGCCGQCDPIPPAEEPAGFRSASLSMPGDRVAPPELSLAMRVSSFCDPAGGDNYRGSEGGWCFSGKSFAETGRAAGTAELLLAEPALPGAPGAPGGHRTGSGAWGPLCRIRKIGRWDGP